MKTMYYLSALSAHMYVCVIVGPLFVRVVPN